MSISSLLLLHHRVTSRPPRVSLVESVRSCWYVPWLAMVVALAGLVLAAIAALEIVTARLQPTPSSQRGHVEELMADVESIGVPR